MKIKNNTNNNLNNSSWLKTRHYIFIFFKIFLVVGILIGSILSIIFSSFYISQDQKKNGEFGNTYNLRYEVDLNVDTANKNLSGEFDNTKESSLKRLEKTARSFETWLFSKEVYNDGVQYSIKQRVDGTYQGWIFTNLYNIEQTEFQFEEVNRDPMSVLLENTNNNFLEIIPYDKKTNPTNLPINNAVVLNSLGLNVENAFLSNTNLNDDNNSSLKTNGVEFSFSNEVSIKKFMEYKAGKITNVDDLSSNYKWFIFNDIDKLIQRLNYVKSVSYWRQNDHSAKYLIEGEKGSLPLTLYNPALFKSQTPGVPDGVENLNHLEFLYFDLTEEEKTWGDLATGATEGGSTIGDDSISVNKKNILDFYNQFDSSSPSSSTDKTTGNFDISIQALVKPYIVAEITADNYHEYFPESFELSPIQEEGEEGVYSTNSRLPPPGTLEGPELVTKFKIPVVSETTLPDFLFQDPTSKTANSLLDFFKQDSSFAPIADFKNSSIVPNDAEVISFFGLGSVTSPLIQDSITGMSAYNSMFLATGIILLTIGIIVSIIYRVPGFFGALSIIFTTVITFAFSNLLGLTFSFGSFLAVIMGALLSLLSVIVFLERMRKNMIDDKSIFDSNIISIKKSIITIIDIHIVSLIIGLVVAMMGALEMVDLGFELILASLVSLVSIFVIFLFVQYNFSKTKLFWKNGLYFFGIEKKIQTIYSEQKVISKKINKSFKISAKLFISAIIIFISITLIVISLVFTIGIQNSIDFKSGTSLYIYEPVNVNKVITLLGGNWTIKVQDGFTLLQTSQIFSESQIMNILKPILTNTNNIFVADSTINILLKTSSINTLALLASSGFIAIYVFIRLGVFAVLPIFISTILITIFSASIQYVLYIPIDNYFIYAMTFVFVLNNILSVMFISIIKSRFTKRQIFDRKDIKIFLEKNILNLKHLWITLLIVVTISLGVSMIFISTTLVWSFLAILISLIISIPSILLLNSYLYYVLLLFRQKYINNIIIENISNTAYKYDLVDEQLIEGINFRG